MSFVRELVIRFIREHLHEREKHPEWLFERLAKEKQQHQPSQSPQSNSSFSTTNDGDNLTEPQREIVQNSLTKIARDFEIFIGNKYNDRFPELTEPLIPKLKNGSKQKYYEAFKAISDELFSQDISWSHIVTFLVYSAELTNKVLELPPQNDKDKTFKMVSQIIKSICRYFDDKLLQWVENQETGWLDVVEYEKQAERSMNGKHDDANYRGVKQYLGVAAVAAIIGGLYLCSKLTVQ